MKTKLTNPFRDNRPLWEVQLICLREPVNREYVIKARTVGTAFHAAVKMAKEEDLTTVIAGDVRKLDYE